MFRRNFAPSSRFLGRKEDAQDGRGAAAGAGSRRGDRARREVAGRHTGDSAGPAGDPQGRGDARSGVRAAGGAGVPAGVEEARASGHAAVERAGAGGSEVRPGLRLGSAADAGERHDSGAPDAGRRCARGGSEVRAPDADRQREPADAGAAARGQRAGGADRPRGGGKKAWRALARAR